MQGSCTPVASPPARARSRSGTTPARRVSNQRHARLRPGAAGAPPRPSPMRPWHNSGAASWCARTGREPPRPCARPRPPPGLILQGRDELEDPLVELGWVRARPAEVGYDAVADGLRDPGILRLP